LTAGGFFAARICGKVFARLYFYRDTPAGVSAFPLSRKESMAAMPHDLRNIATLQPLGVLLLFFVAHLLAGAAAPYVRGYRPPLTALMEMAGLALERRLNRAGRSPGQLMWRGVFVVALLGLAGGAAGIGMAALATREYGWAAELVLLSLCVSVMAPLKTLRVVLRALDKEDVKLAAYALSPYVEEDISRLDAHGLVRRALEFAAVGLNRFCVAPVLFFAVLHAAGLAWIVAALAMYEAFGAAEPERLHFGRAIRKIEWVLNYIPARVTVALMLLASVFVPGATPVRGLKTAWTQARFYTPGNNGCLVAAMAGSLGVTLGGRILRRTNYVIENKWIGPAGSTAQTTVTDLQRGAMLMFVSYLWLIVAVSGVFLAINIFP
jgi:adenosylcobinamide-phosphate synthase